MRVGLSFIHAHVYVCILQGASTVAVLPLVRAALLEYQQVLPFSLLKFMVKHGSYNNGQPLRARLSGSTSSGTL